MFLPFSATFFQLRKLHDWKPQGQRDDAEVLRVDQETDGKMQTEQDDGVSLLHASYIMFSDLELPPEFAKAALMSTQLTDDTTSTAELGLLRQFKKTRDQKMVRMLRRAIKTLIRVVTGILGRFKNLVEFALNKSNIQACTVEDRHLCANENGFKEATFLVLQFILAAHLGVYMSREGRLSAPLEDIQGDFLKFITEVAWFRYRPHGVHLFKKRPRWALNELAAYIFPSATKRQEDVPFSAEEMSLLRQAGKPRLL